MTATPERSSSPNRTKWQIMATTPMRDIVRGRPTCRLDLTIYPERHDLPMALAGVVVQTASRTRLHAREKADVARELAAHFAEGVASGKTTDDLIEAFGDVKKAAKLIRRSKKRNRSRVIRAMKRTTATTFAIIAILYAGVLIWYVTGSGKVNPSHDYLADMNAVAAAVPEEDRAWPMYREAFISLGKVPKNVRDCKGISDYRWAKTVAYIESHQPEIDQIRRAAAIPGLGYIADIRFHNADLPLMDPDNEITGVAWVDDNPNRVIPTLYSLLPHLGYLRSASRLLWFDTLRRLETGTTSGARENIEAMVDIARQSSEHPMLVSQLARISIITLAIDTANELLASHDVALTERDLVALDSLFNPAIAGNLCAMSVEGERIFLEDVEQHIYTDNGHGNGRLRTEMMEEVWGKPLDSGTPLVLSAPLSALMPDRRTFRAQARELIDTAVREQNMPMWERDASELDQLIAQIESSGWTSFRWSFLTYSMPAIERVLANADTAALQRDALITAISLHRYHRANNHWPATLSVLVPDYLDSIPLDRFDGQPLRYKLDDIGDPILYSIGANFEDDNGVPGYDDEGWPTNNETRRWNPRSEVESIKASAHRGSHIAEVGVGTGDFILWPPLPIKPIEPEPDDEE